MTGRLRLADLVLVRLRGRIRGISARRGLPQLPDGKFLPADGDGPALKWTKKHARQEFRRFGLMTNRPLGRAYARASRGEPLPYCGFANRGTCIKSSYSAALSSNAPAAQKTAAYLAPVQRGAQLDLRFERPTRQEVFASDSQSKKRAGIQGRVFLFAARLSSPRECCSIRHYRISNGSRTQTANSATT